MHFRPDSSKDDETDFCPFGISDKDKVNLVQLCTSAVFGRYQRMKAFFHANLVATQSQSYGWLYILPSAHNMLGFTYNVEEGRIFGNAV